MTVSLSVSHPPSHVCSVGAYGQEANDYVSPDRRLQLDRLTVGMTRERGGLTNQQERAAVWLKIIIDVISHSF